MKSLNNKVVTPTMRRRVYGIVNRALFSHKKNVAFRLSQSGIHAFYQPVNRPVSLGIVNFPKKHSGFRSVDGCLGGKRFERFFAEIESSPADMPIELQVNSNPSPTNHESV